MTGNENTMVNGSLKAEDHYGLVWSVVRRYQGMRCENGIVDPDDLFQEGVIALINCIHYWDPEKGCGFPHYAIKAIEHHVSVYIFGLRTVHPPRSTYIALKAGRVVDRGGLISQSVKDSMNLNRHYEECHEKAYVLPDNGFEASDDRDAVRRMLSTVLDEREQDVLRRLYAIETPKESTLAIAARWKINRNTINDIAKKALKRLKSHIVTNPMKGVASACPPKCLNHG